MCIVEKSLDKCLVRIVLLSNVFFPPVLRMANDVMQCLDSLKSDRSLWDLNIIRSSMVILNEISNGLPSACCSAYIHFNNSYIEHHVVQRLYCKKDCFLDKTKPNQCSVIMRTVKHLKLTILKEQICHGKIGFALNQYELIVLDFRHPSDQNSIYIAF